jgi:uncharacterized protein (DUF488 family)
MTSDNEVEDCPLYKVYTFGYEGKKIKELDAEVNRLGATIVDVRYAPYGRNKDFNRPELQRRYGAKYVWIQELGNKNYKTGGKTEFVDAGLGARRLGSITSDGTPVILLCVCKNPETCHRNDLAKKLNEECGWEVHHLPQVEKVQETGSLFAE